MEQECYNMDETIKKIREYLQLNDDWYINRQLDILEKQIAIRNNKSRIKTRQQN